MLLNILLFGLLAIAAYAIFLFLRWFLSPITSCWSSPSPTSYTYTLLPSSTPFPQALLFADDVWQKNNNRVYLSLIIPCYNEYERLDVMMLETMTYLESRSDSDPSFTYELLFVDDGSRDQTASKILQYRQQYGDIVRLVQLPVNQGKGGAVQQGMLHARGDYLLMVDGDGATKFSDIDKLEKQLISIEKNKHGIAVGSRAHLQSSAVAQRTFFRNLLMHGFHALVQLFIGTHIKDTQCGFKLFTRATAQLLFCNQHLRRWCFDVELLYIARAFNIPVVEVSVNWQEIPGSKIRILESSLLMGRDLVIIRLCYMLKIWRILRESDIERIKHRMNGNVNATMQQSNQPNNNAQSTGINKRK